MKKRDGIGLIMGEIVREENKTKEESFPNHHARNKKILRGWVKRRPLETKGSKTKKKENRFIKTLKTCISFGNFNYAK